MRRQDQRRLLFIILGLLGLAACDEEVYPCASNASCVIQGVQGLCLPAGAGTSYCAFGDGKCPSGYRWDTSAPSTIDGNCVIGPIPGVKGQSSDGGFVASD